MPSVPYRGIRPFRYEDHPIFFAREREAERLASLVSVYRGTMLYGETGAGKSSLINAGLLPRALELGFHPERVRVQPRAGEAFVVEPLGGDDAGRTVLSTAELEQRVEAACALQRPLLVFDQFEELVTLFEGGPEAGALREQIVELLVRLLRSPLPVKLLFVFREDYLGKVKELLRACPELVDQALQLAPLAVETLPTIVRGPFERYPGHFARELDPALAARLEAALAVRFGSGELSLSEVQTVCLRLWQADDPHRLLAERGVQGLLEDYLGEALDAFPPQTRFAAVALLAQMVTAAGTRNVIAAEDLVQRVREEDPSFAPELLLHALDRLDRESRLVRHERRRDLDLYEITSEFLVPWISERRAEAQRLRERRRDRRRLLALGAVAAVLIAVVAVVVWFAVSAAHERDRAKRAARTATALALAVASGDASTDRLDLSLLLALGAFETDRGLVARDALVTALARLRASGLAGLMRGHEGIVHAVAVSPSGGVIASGGDDGTVRLWSARTHRQLGAPLLPRGRPIEDVAFADGGATLVAGGDDGTVRSWDVASHRRVGEPLRVSPSGVAALAVHGRLLATATWDAKARLWDRSTGRRRGPVLSLSSPPNALALSRDGRLLAVGGEDGIVGLWRLATHPGRGAGAPTQLAARAVPLAQPPYGLEVRAVAFGADGLLAAASDPGIVRFWDGRSGAARGGQVRAEHHAGVSSIAFTHDGRTLAVASWDGRVRLWNGTTRRPLAASFTAATDPVHDLAFAPGDHTLAMADGDGTVGVWPIGRPRFPQTLAGDRGPVADVAYSPDGALLASTAADGGVRLWSAADGRQVGALGGAQLMTSVDFSSDGRLLAAGTWKWARLWDVARRRLVASLPVGRDADALVAFSRDGSTLAVGDDSGTARVWDVASRRLRGAPLHERSDGISALALAPDGSRLAAGIYGGPVRVWDLGSRPRLRRMRGGHDNTVTGVDFSPDGAQLASAGTDQTVRLWRLADGAQVALLRGHDNSVGDVKFSPGGQLLASVGEDGAARLWTLRGRRPLGAPLWTPGGTLTSVAFSPDGTSLAAAGSDGAIRIWRGVLWHDFDRLRDELCGVLGGGLSAHEWRQSVPAVPYVRTCPE